MQKDALQQWVCIVLFVLLLVITGCSRANETLSLDSTKCDGLRAELDNAIYDTTGTLFEQYGSSLIALGLQPRLVGGELVAVSDPWYIHDTDEELGIVTYTLSFKGQVKSGDLLLRTASKDSLPYTVGSFYQFNATATKEDLRSLGAYNDHELKRLRLASCSAQ